MLPSDDHSNIGSYFTKFSEKSQDIFWLRDQNFSKFLYVSPACELIFQEKLKNIYDKPECWIKHIHPEDKSQYKLYIENIKVQKMNKLDKTPFCITYRLLKHDGKISWLKESSYVIEDNSGNPVGYAGISQDITEAILKEQSLTDDLRIAELFLPKFIERLEKSVFWVRDITLQKQLYLSPAYEKIWGVPAKKLFENPASWSDSILPEDRTKRTVTDMLHTEKRLGPSAKYEDIYRIRRPVNQIRWIKDTSFPIYDNSNSLIGFAGIAEDITKEKLYENELKAAKEKAEIANAAKTEFIMNMSHDLRTPLNGILAFTDYLASQEKDATKKDMLTDILFSSTALLSLLNNILSLTDIESGNFLSKKNQFNLNDTIQQAVTLIKNELKNKNLSLKIDYSKEIPEVLFGDSIRIQRILTNLLGNATKFTHQGTITIKAYPITSDADTLFINLEIQDTGIGIPEDKKEVVFERFTRLTSSYKDQKYEGSGLGLYIVKRFIDDLSGKITLESKENKGTTFVCTLPLNKTNFA